MLVHTDDLARVYDGDAQRFDVHAVQFGANLLLVADENDLTVVLLRRVDRAPDNLPGRKISAHRIDRYIHPALPSPMRQFRHLSSETTINFARKTSLSPR